MDQTNLPKKEGQNKNSIYNHSAKQDLSAPPVPPKSPILSKPSIPPIPPASESKIKLEPLASASLPVGNEQYKLAMREVQGPKPPLVSNSGSKLASIAIALALLIIIGIGGYYFYVKDNNSQPIIIPDATVIPAADKNLDSDNDGLPDAIEKVLGTNSFSSDTDGDTYLDLNEIKNGYSPLSAGAEGRYAPEQLAEVKNRIKAADEELYRKELEIGDKTVALKIFKDEEDGFVMQYSENLTVESKKLRNKVPGGADVYEIKPTSIKILIGGSMTWEVEKENLVQGIDGQNKDIVIDGINSIRREGIATGLFAYSELQGKEVVEIILERPIGSIIHFYSLKQEEKILDQIISNFKVVKKN